MILKFFVKVFLISNLFLNSIFCNYDFAILHGSECRELSSFMAELRIKLYRDYPYLYEGNINEGIEYLNWFLNLPKTFVAIASFNKNPIAFVSGTSFKDFDDHFKGSIQAFENANLFPENYFYITDCLVEPDHQNKGVLTKLMKLIEEKVSNIDNYKFCLVTEDHVTHPLKPKDYKSTDKIWKKLGYKKSNISIKFNYPTIQVDNSNKEEEHIFTYWLKNN